MAEYPAMKSRANDGNVNDVVDELKREAGERDHLKFTRSYAVAGWSCQSLAHNSTPTQPSHETITSLSK